MFLDVFSNLGANELRAQYETNYLDARKSSGKYIAESLFSKAVRRKSKSKEGTHDFETEE
jgi:hypothetical protein